MKFFLTNISKSCLTKIMKFNDKLAIQLKILKNYAFTIASININQF